MVDWHEASSDEEGYNGWANWDTWETYNIISNERDTMAQASRFWDLQRFEQWVIENIIGPYNQERQAEAHEWNAIPEHDRLDYDYERLKEDSPQAADLVNQLGFGPDVRDVDLNETFIDERTIDWIELFNQCQDEDSEFRIGRTADADNWYEPQMTNRNEGVEMPGEAPGLNPEGDLPDKPATRPTGEPFSRNWVYLEGEVAFGQHFWELVQQCGKTLGWSENEIEYVSNVIARNALPQDVDIAAGTITGGRIQIFVSTIDRNYVWDMVDAARKK